MIPRWAKLAGAMLPLGSFLVGAGYAVDARYAKAGDVNREAARISGQLNVQVNELKVLALQNQRTSYERERFDLRTIPRRERRPLTEFEERRLGDVETSIDRLTFEIRRYGGQ